MLIVLNSNLLLVGYSLVQGLPEACVLQKWPLMGTYGGQDIHPLLIITPLGNIFIAREWVPRPGLR